MMMTMDELLKRQSTIKKEMDRIRSVVDGQRNTILVDLPYINDEKCKAITTTKKQCGFNVKKGSGFCGRHITTKYVDTITYKRDKVMERYNANDSWMNVLNDSYSKELDKSYLELGKEYTELSLRISEMRLQEHKKQYVYAPVPKSRIDTILANEMEKFLTELGY